MQKHAKEQFFTQVYDPLTLEELRVRLEELREVVVSLTNSYVHRDENIRVFVMQAKLLVRKYD
eukprot:snap_masked-scaffold_46-processed-gene-1.82-mRNA-1 protein AED:1.00 eAED:1.00 QI:0/0/0/0/1/1/2/0/62